MGTYNRDAAAAYAIQFTDTRSGFGKYNQDGFGYIDPKKMVKAVEIVLTLLLSVSGLADIL